MPANQLRPLIIGGLLALIATSASAAGDTPEKILGFTREQVGDVALCSARASFAMAAYVQYKGKQTREQARVTTGGLGTPSERQILAEIDRVYDAKPTEARDWAETRFVACLAEKKVPIAAKRAAVCYDATFWISILVSLRVEGHSRAEVVESIVTDKASTRLRELVGAEYDEQKRGDRRQANMRNVGQFLQCTAARAKGQPAPKPAGG